MLMVFCKCDLIVVVIDLGLLISVICASSRRRFPVSAMSNSPILSIAATAASSISPITSSRPYEEAILRLTSTRTSTSGVNRLRRFHWTTCSSLARPHRQSYHRRANRRSNRRVKQDATATTHRSRPFQRNKLRALIWCSSALELWPIIVFY